MKNIVKRFGQFINESKEFGEDYGIERGSSSNNLTIPDLLDCWVQTNQPRGTVLALVDISNPSRDLIDGGIELIINPSDREIGVAQHDGTYYAELYKDGERVTNDSDFDMGDEY